MLAAPPSRLARSPTISVSPGGTSSCPSAIWNRRGCGFWTPCSNDSVTVDELSQPVVIEVRPQRVVNVTHDADAQAACLQTLQNRGCISIRHGGAEVAVAVAN